MKQTVVICVALASLVANFAPHNFAHAEQDGVIDVELDSESGSRTYGFFIPIPGIPIPQPPGTSEPACVNDIMGCTTTGQTCDTNSMCAPGGGPPVDCGSVESCPDTCDTGACTACIVPCP